VNPEAHPKSTLTFAYGEGRFKEMQKSLSGTDNVLRTKILIEINEDFHQADKVNVALDDHILEELVKCFKANSGEQDDVIRELASRAVLKVAQTEKGRETLIHMKTIAEIKNLFNDAEVQIRNNAYVSLINLAEFRFGIDAIIDAGILPILIDKLVLDKEESILILILTLLKVLAEGEKAPSILLGTPALARLNGHLGSKNAKIRELAALNIGSISFNVHGKERTIEAHSIEPLTRMLFDKVSEVRTAATRALASLAQLKAGKVEIYDLEMLDRIIELLYDASE